LTEAWQSTVDGAILPLAPGVAGGDYDRQRHGFINFGVDDVVRDLEEFIARLHAVNPRARVILTVSPQPMIATFEDQHVLTASVYSKSVLRVAADIVARRHDHVDYFPAYEVAVGSFSRGAYFERDLRSITAAGIEHVMRLFLDHFGAGQDRKAQLAATLEAAFDELCDEELLDPN